MRTVFFKGECHKVVLESREVDDPHIVVQFWTEDDDVPGRWFKSANAFSSAWLPEFQRLLADATQWMTNNADPDMYMGAQYGWKFRS